jgi:hypothetical protein
MAAAEGNPYKVILVGEKHGDDLGEALTEVFGEFVNGENLKKYGFAGGQSDFVFYYETPKIDKEVVFFYRNRPVTRTFLPLEQVTGVLSSGKNVFDSVVQESVPSVMTSIFYLLNSLSQLMSYYLNPRQFDAVAMQAYGSGTGGVSAIQTVVSETNRLSDVLVNTTPGEPFGQFRTRMRALFPDQLSLQRCIDNFNNQGCKERFIDLYEIIRQYFELFKTTHKQYAHIVFPTSQVTLMGKPIQLIHQTAAYAKIYHRLLEDLDSERDDLMVRKLKSSIDASIAEGGNPRQISVVVVGNIHFVNMKRLLSTPPFEVIFEKTTRLEPRKGALVLIQGLQSRPDLNGEYGIVTGAANGNGRTPVFCGDVGGPPLALLREKFEVVDETPKDAALEEFFTPVQFAYAKSLLLGGGSKRYKKCSKRYKKCSKHRCYARTRKGKRYKRRSAKKY